VSQLARRIVERDLGQCGGLEDLLRSLSHEDRSARMAQCSGGRARRVRL
jgi:hypothetical protein